MFYVQLMCGNCMVHGQSQISGLKTVWTVQPTMNHGVYRSCFYWFALLGRCRLNVTVLAWSQHLINSFVITQHVLHVCIAACFFLFVFMFCLLVRVNTGSIWQLEWESDHGSDPCEWCERPPASVQLHFVHWSDGGRIRRSTSLPTAAGTVNTDGRVQCHPQHSRIISSLIKNVCGTYYDKI
jgi:hypothetical protein